MGPKCFWCMYIFRWIPVLIILAIIAWSYYAYVIKLCFIAVENVIERTFYLMVFHCIFTIFLWSYWQTIFTPYGAVPPQFKLTLEDATKLRDALTEEDRRHMLETVARNLPVCCRNPDGAIRYCAKCHNVQPDRAHHCSVCGACVLKMDHHCPWVNNCVCFTNYKFFILFLGYAIVYCSFIAATSAHYFINFWAGPPKRAEKLHLLFLFFMSVIFALSLWPLFGYHLYLITKNVSTLESMRHPVFTTGPRKSGFSLGRCANFVQVFGEKKSLWFLPVKSSLGDGVSFPNCTQERRVSYNSTANTQNVGVKSDVFLV